MSCHFSGLGLQQGIDFCGISSFFNWSTSPPYSAPGMLMLHCHICAPPSDTKMVKYFSEHHMDLNLGEFIYIRHFLN